MNNVCLSFWGVCDTKPDLHIHQTASRELIADKMQKPLTEWRLPDNSDHLFYPFGLKCYGNQQKCAVLVWNHNQLCSLIFDHFAEDISLNAKPKKIICHPIGCLVRDIIAGPTESVIITERGTVWHFLRRSRIEPIDYLANIKYVCVTRTGFALISASSDNGQIMLIIHPMNFPCEAQDIKCYDLSFSTNHCQSNWITSRYCVRDFQPNVAEPQLFQFLRNCPNEEYTYTLPCLFVGIDNNFLAFIQSDDGSHRFNHIQSYASPIEHFWQSKDNRAIYILLASGTLEIICWCSTMYCVRTFQLYFGEDIQAYDTYANWFLYTDGQKVVGAHIRCSSGEKKYKYTRRVWNICGVIGLSYSFDADAIVCVTENRQFFAILLEADKITDPDECHTLTVDKSFVEYAERVAMVSIVQLNDMYKDICRQNIELNRNFKIAALKYNHNRKDSILRLPIVASVRMCRSIPVDVPATAICMQTPIAYDSRTFFVHINIRIEQEQQHISRNIVWNLLIRAQGADTLVTCKSLRLFAEAFSAPIDIVMPMRQDGSMVVVPKISAELSTCLCIGHEFLYISFPIDVRQASIGELLEVYAKRPRFFPGEVNSRVRLGGEPPGGSEKSWLSHKCSVNEVKFCDILDVLPNHRDNFASTKSHVIYVILFRSVVEIEFDNAGECIEFRSHDAGALRYVKEFVCCQLIEKFGDVNRALTTSKERIEQIQVSKTII